MLIEVKVIIFLTLFPKTYNMSKLPNVGTTIFSVMSKMATEHNAVNLSQGFPNFPVDQKLLDIYARNLSLDVHQYAPMPGNPNLLAAIQDLIQGQYGRLCSTENELLVTAGATQGIFTAIQALITFGDEVIVLDPCYDCYDPSIVLAGGNPVHVALDENYMPDWDKILSSFNSKTKMIITNNPHNPSGRMWDESDFTKLEGILEKYPKVILISDEVYEFITFEKKHISSHTRKSLLERSIIISSFGKTFHITGWKMGYLVAPPKLLVEIKKCHQFIVFSVNSVAQATLAEYILETNVNELGRFYQQKRDLFTSLLKTSKFKLLPSDGTYFQVADYSSISNEDDVSFTKKLVQEFGVATIPLSVFSKDERPLKHIRFCFAKTDETLIKASEKLCRI